MNYTIQRQLTVARGLAASQKDLMMPISAMVRMLIELLPLVFVSLAHVSPKPQTLLRFHKALVKLKYRWLFSPRKHARPGPKGPSPDIIAAVVAMKQHNPRMGWRKIAEHIDHTFGDRRIWPDETRMAEDVHPLGERYPLEDLGERITGVF